MSWTLIICESARSYNTEMESFLDVGVLSEMHSLPKGGYCFQYGFEVNAMGLVSQPKKKLGQTTNTVQKCSQERQRVHLREGKAKSRGKVNLESEEKKKKQKGLRWFHILLTSCCLSA